MNGESDLPEGWKYAILKDITFDVKNFKPEDDPKRLFEYIDISSINNRIFSIGEVKSFLGNDAPSRARRPIRKDDVLFSNVRTYLRNIAIVPKKYDNQLCSTGFTLLRPSSVILPKYLFYFVLTDSFIEKVSPQQRGSQYPATSDGVVKSVSIPLPPLAEQRRIVAAVEALLDRVNASRERLDRVPGLLKAFRQAVLAAACSGRLTEGWREDRDLNEASNSLESSGDLGLVDIPLSWKWITIGDITESMRNGIYKEEKFYTSDGIACLRMYNIENGKIIWKNIKRLNLTIKEIEDYRLEPGDILINRVNSRELVGKAAPIPEGLEDCVFESKNIRLKINHKISDYRFIGYCFQIIAHNFYDLHSQQTVGMATINQKQIKLMPIPLPPLLEQHEIVRRVESFFSLADNIEQRVAAGKERADRLTQAILAKAFRGELVPTEAELARREGREYEPASVLLERIREEKERENAKVKKRSRQKKALSK